MGPNPSCVVGIAKVQRQNRWRNKPEKPAREQRATVLTARDEDMGNKHESGKEE